MNDYVTISWVVIISGYLAVISWLLCPLVAALFKAAKVFFAAPVRRRSWLAD